MPSFFITTLGCKVNQYESAALAGMLRRRGWERAPDLATASLVVINTCCVTAKAMRKCRNIIGQSLRKVPDARFLVTGCYINIDREQIWRLFAAHGLAPGRVVLAGHRESLPPWIGQPAPAQQEPGPPTADFEPIDRFPEHQRAFVKVQDGCDAFCSYCIVPLARSRIWSRNPADIIEECRTLVNHGHREIVLCGVNLGAFGWPGTARSLRPAGGPSPLASLTRLVGGIAGLWRVRLSSLDPGDLDEPLLAACREVPTLAPHFHLPLQSGSDAILARMNRRYRAGDFLDTISRLRDVLDRPAITTDIIVGFPGETQDDFQQTLRVLRQAGVAQVHAFPFSPMAGTAAAGMTGHVAPEVADRRLAELNVVELELSQAYRQQFVGQVLEGVVENRRRRGKSVIMTDRHISVLLAAPAQPGQVVRVRITKSCPEGLQGHLLSTEAT